MQKKDLLVVAIIVIAAIVLGVIHRLGRILIAIDVNIAAPVSPVFFQRRIRIKAAGVHIPDATLSSPFSAASSRQER